MLRQQLLYRDIIEQVLLSHPEYFESLLLRHKTALDAEALLSNHFVLLVNVSGIPTDELLPPVAKYRLVPHFLVA